MNLISPMVLSISSRPSAASLSEVTEQQPQSPQLGRLTLAGLGLTGAGALGIATGCVLLMGGGAAVVGAGFVLPIIVLCLAFGSITASAGVGFLLASLLTCLSGQESEASTQPVQESQAKNREALAADVGAGAGPQEEEWSEPVLSPLYNREVSEGRGGSGVDQPEAMAEPGPAHLLNESAGSSIAEPEGSRSAHASSRKRRHKAHRKAQRNHQPAPPNRVEGPKAEAEPSASSPASSVRATARVPAAPELTKEDFATLLQTILMLNVILPPAKAAPKPEESLARKVSRRPLRARDNLLERQPVGRRPQASGYVAHNRASRFSGR